MTITSQPDQHILLRKILAKKKAVIWDFDRVIGYANWHGDGKQTQWWENLWQLLESREPQIRQQFSQGLGYYYEHTDFMVEKHGDEAAREINDHYLHRELEILPTSCLNPAIVEIIKTSPDDQLNFIWSNNQAEFILRMLEPAGILNRIITVVSRDKIRLAKPNLDGFALIQASCATPLEPSDYLFVGDSLETDGKAAAKLNIDFFHYQAFEPATKLITTPPSLKKDF